MNYGSFVSYTIYMLFFFCKIYARFFRRRKSLLAYDSSNLGTSFHLIFIQKDKRISSFFFHHADQRDVVDSVTASGERVLPGGPGSIPHRIKHLV